MKKLLNIFIQSVMIMLFIESCTIIKDVNKISQLKNPIETGEIKIITKDGVEYTLNNYHLEDTILYANGFYMQKAETYPFDRIRPFNGNLNLSNISYIYTKNGSFWKTFAGFGIAVFILGSSVDIIGELHSSSLQVTAYKGTYNPKGSCPAVYSWDGSREYYESETVAGAIFKNAERISYDVLKHLKPINGKLELKLKNEKPETDYVNELKLIAVDVKENIKVIPDMDGKLFTISRPVNPKTCLDFSGNDKLADISKDDDKYWESDLNAKDFSKESGTRDGLILEFNKPLTAPKAKLVIRAINTGLMNYAFEELQKLKGRALLKWYYDLDNNLQERIKLFNLLYRYAFLNIKIMKNGVWKSVRQMIYTGADIEKEQVTDLDIGEIPGNNLKIKIESTAGLWKINNIYIDYSAESEYESTELSAEKATDSFGCDITDLLLKSDNKYYTAVNKESASLIFNDIPLKENLKRFYILKTGGYYLQWFPKMTNEPSETFSRIMDEPYYGCKIYLPRWRELNRK
jgi:hypothetical protein